MSDVTVHAHDIKLTLKLFASNGGGYRFEIHEVSAGNDSLEIGIERCTIQYCTIEEAGVAGKARMKELARMYSSDMAG